MNNLYKSTENQIEKYTLCHVPRLGRLVLNMSLYLALSGPNIACKEKNKPKQIPTQRSDTNLPQPATLSSQSTLTQQVKQSASTNPSNKAPQKQPSTVQSSDKDPQTLFGYLNNTDHEKSARDVLQKMIKNFFGGLELYQEDKNHYIKILTANSIVFLPKTNLEYFLNTHIHLMNETKTIFSFLSDVWKKELEDEPKKSDQYFDKIEGFYTNLKNDLETKVEPKVEDSSNQKYLSQAQQKHIESMRDEPDKRHIFAICYIYKEIEPLPDERLDKSGQSCKSLILEALRKKIKTLNDQITRQDKKFSQQDLAVYGIMPAQPQQPKQRKTLDQEWKKYLNELEQEECITAFKKLIKGEIDFYIRNNNIDTMAFKEQLENIFTNDTNFLNHKTIQEGLKVTKAYIMRSNQLWNSFEPDKKQDLFKMYNAQKNTKYHPISFIEDIHDERLNTEQKKLKKESCGTNMTRFCWLSVYIFETIEEEKRKDRTILEKSSRKYRDKKKKYHALLKNLGLNIEKYNNSGLRIEKDSEGNFKFEKGPVMNPGQMKRYLKYKNKE